MRLNTKKKLIEAINYCENRQKSVEFTIQYMQDYADVDLDCVMKFLKQYANKNEILKSFEDFYLKNSTVPMSLYSEYY